MLCVALNDPETTHRMGRSENATASSSKAWRPMWLYQRRLDILAQLLERPRHAEVDRADRRDDEEDDDGDRAGESHLVPALAFERETIGVAQEDVSRSGRRQGVRQR